MELQAKISGIHDVVRGKVKVSLWVEVGTGHSRVRGRDIATSRAGVRGNRVQNAASMRAYYQDE